MVGRGPLGTCRRDPGFGGKPECLALGGSRGRATGLGSDGTKGCESLVNAGGTVWAQDEASSVVWGMPGSVVRAGLASRIVALEDLGGEITRAIATRPANLRADTGAR